MMFQIAAYFWGVYTVARCDMLQSWSFKGTPLIVILKITRPHKAGDAIPAAR